VVEMCVALVIFITIFGPALLEPFLASQWAFLAWFI
jgi:hypothetical protein